MAKRYIIAVPAEVYNNYLAYKKDKEKEVSNWAGKNIKITNPQFINALVLKNKEIEGLIPFNKNTLYKISNLKRGKYGL